jgi:hypothetical protein
MTEDRYWILTSLRGEDTSQHNRINEVAEAANLSMVGIVDEEAGGVVAYVTVDLADEIVKRLNGYIHPNHRLSFEPEAIIEHFDGEVAGEELRELLASDPERLNALCMSGLDGDELYREFHEIAVYIYEIATGHSYTGQEAS